MRLRWRIIITLLVTVFAVVYTLPSIPQVRESPLGQFLPKEQVSLGLDLMGGIYLTLGVGVDEAVDNHLMQTIQTLRSRAEDLASQKGFGDDFKLLRAVERLGPAVFGEEKGSKDVCANVDLFSGLIYHMLGISEDLYTPLFAISRIPGWCAHRTEEIIFANRIIRPAYKYLGVRQKYYPLSERI